ncbi:hypothetical protein GFS31_33710 [Leptolyngbya sp. BL0902]|nr:hypothetical protein GFS31_33710 [Leptolyngbya sp. BL0902]
MPPNAKAAAPAPKKPAAVTPMSARTPTLSFGFFSNFSIPLISCSFVSLFVPDIAESFLFQF